MWIPQTDEVFFASNDGGPLGLSDLNNNNQVSRISLKDPQIAKGGLATVTKVGQSFLIIISIYPSYLYKINK